MIQKYKKIGLAAVVCTLLGMNAAEAAVILTFAQDGLNVTATWSGTYDVPAYTPTSTVNMTQGSASFERFNESRTGSEIIFVGGVGSASTVRIVDEGVFVLTALPSVFDFNGSYTGSTFGFRSGGERLPIPPPGSAGLILASGTAPGSFSPVGTMTFADTTLAAMGTANYDNTLAFTGYGSVDGSREIRFQTAGVPEPTTGILSLLAVGGLTQRRRR